MRVSLVALDLDDTLLSEDLSISPANESAVRAVLDRGIPVVLASGRTIESMRPYAAQLGMPGRGLPIICSNGSEVRSLDLDTVMRRMTLSAETCRAIRAVMEDLGLPVQAYEPGAIIVSERNEWTELDTRLTGLPTRLQHHADELVSVPRVKLLVSGSPERLAAVLGEVRARLGTLAHVVMSKPYFMELLPLGADKGDALAWVASRLAIPQSEVMAVGDGGNDVGMLRWAGVSCSPADASGEALGAAKYHARLAHGHGAVAELLERFVLNT